MPALAPEMASASGIVKKSIILTPRTLQQAEEAQELLGEMSLSHFFRQLITEFVPSVIENRGFPGAGRAGQKLYLEPDLMHNLEKIGRDLGLPVSSVATLMLQETLEAWVKKAQQARKRMERASSDLEGEDDDS